MGVMRATRNASVSQGRADRASDPPCPTATCAMCCSSTSTMTRNRPAGASVISSAPCSSGAPRRCVRSPRTTTASKGADTCARASCDCTSSSCACAWATLANVSMTWVRSALAVASARALSSCSSWPRPRSRSSSRSSSASSTSSWPCVTRSPGRTWTCRRKPAAGATRVRCKAPSTRARPPTWEGAGQASSAVSAAPPAKAAARRTYRVRAGASGPRPSRRARRQRHWRSRSCCSSNTGAAKAATWSSAARSSASRTC